MKKTITKITAIVAILAILGLMVISATANASSRYGFFENFSQFPGGKCVPDGAVVAPWKSEWNGYGCVKVDEVEGNKVISLKPKMSSQPDEYHSALVLGPHTTGNVVFQTKVYTEEQLREGSEAAGWEMAWIAWNWHGDEFYYFIPKLNGWELGKKDRTLDLETGEPIYEGTQRYLATGTDKTFELQEWYEVTILQFGNWIRVYVDGEEIVTFEDTERPYMEGNIGLYTEQAHAYYDDIEIFNRNMNLSH